MADHTISVDVTAGTVSPTTLTIYEGDTVTWEPSNGTIKNIQPISGNNNLFSSGPSQVPNSSNWSGTAGQTDGTENYKIEVSYWIDPQLQVDHPPS